MLRGLIAALVSAACYGTGSVLQAKAATSTPGTVGTPGTPEPAGVDPRLLIRLLGRTPFILGMLLDVCGFAAQFVALRSVPVFLVQTAQAASLAVTALVAVPLLKVRLRPREWSAVGVVTVGLALVGLSAGAEGAAATGPGFRIGLVVAVLVLGGVGLAAGRYGRAVGSAVLGGVAGLGFGIVALAARALTSLSPGHLLRDPASYALALGGVVAFAFYATGLQRGAVTTVTAAVVVGETAAPAVIGILVFGDHTRPGTAPLAVAGFIAALVGAFGLSRFGQLSED